MNRKYNPWVAMVGLLLALILVILCAGCTSVEENDPGEPAEESTRFVYERYAMDGSAYGIRIITDTETGVQYLAYIHGNGVGFTVLQEGEG